MTENKQSLSDMVANFLTTMTSGQDVDPKDLPDLVRKTAQAFLDVEQMSAGKDAGAHRAEPKPSASRSRQDSEPAEMDEEARPATAHGSIFKGKRMPSDPAIEIKKSVTPDYIVCLEDGMKMKMLKRHLATHYSMTPEEYRRKWDLPDNYPMIAPVYALTRSLIAKKSGFGSTDDKRRQNAG